MFKTPNEPIPAGSTILVDQDGADVTMTVEHDLGGAAVIAKTEDGQFFVFRENIRSVRPDKTSRPGA